MVTRMVPPVESDEKGEREKITGFKGGNGAWGRQLVIYGRM